MHRLSSTQSIFRFRLAAVLLCVKWLVLPSAVGALILFLITGNHSIARFGVGMMLLTLLVALLQWLIAARTPCPLCMTPVLAKKNLRDPPPCPNLPRQLPAARRHRHLAPQLVPLPVLP